MFGGRLPQPKHLKPQIKPNLDKQDISMPDFTGKHAHRARQPNTDHAAQWLHYHQRENEYRTKIEKARIMDLTNINAIAKYEITTEKRRLHNLVQDKLNTKIQEYLEKLEEKRERLRVMMAAEEEEYVRETIESAQKANDSKLEDMKKRSDQLKAEKEAQRLEIVKEKRIQQYSNRCAELRPILSRKQTEESKICQLQQMRENEARRQAEKEMDMMWDNLTRKQDEAFWEREVQEAIIKFNQSKKDMDILTMQIRAKKLEEEKNKELERQNVIEAHKIIQLQEQEERDEIRKKMEKRKQDAADLRRQVEIQQEFMAQRKKEEMALDKAYARLAELELQREKSKIVDNKGRLHKEMETYKHYLEHMKERRRIEENELEQLVEECRRQSEKRHEDACCAFQAGRRKLHEDVLKERAAQVEFKREKAERELQWKQEENKMMRDIFETNRRMHDEADRIRRMAVLQYRDDLQKQLEYNFALKKQEMDEAEKRLQDGLEEERRLEELVKEIVQSNILSAKEHPFRRKLVEYDCKCKDNNEYKK